MTHKEKATTFVNLYYIELHCSKGYYDIENAKLCAIIAIKDKYHSLRELLYNLRSCGVIESEKVYLFRLHELIDEEKCVIEEIEKL